MRISSYQTKPDIGLYMPHPLPKTIRSLFLSSLLLLLLSACGPVKESGGIDAAEKLLKSLDYNEAKKQFEAALSGIQHGTDGWVEGNYGLLLSYWHSSPASTENLNKAKEIGAKLLASETVEQGLKYRIQLDLARIDEIADFQSDEIDIANARALYRDVQKNASDPAMAFEAMLRLANTYRKEVGAEAGENAQAIITEHLENTDEVPYWTSMAWQILGDIRGQNLSDYEGALEAYENALSRGFVNPNQNDRYYWRMAYWANENGDTERAIELLAVIVGEMPRSTFQTLARKKIIDLGGTPPELNSLI